MHSSTKIYLIRHGQTEWTLTGQHTGKTDLPLTEEGKKQAQRLSQSLQGISFQKIWVSPLKRAQQTCEFAGLSQHAEIDDDLAEWHYGRYEGLTSQEIKKKDPHWNIFLNGAPDGESTTDISIRINRILMQTHPIHGNIAIFSHGHFLRALTAKWLKLQIVDGNLFILEPASLSILRYEKEHPALALWNYTAIMGQQ